MNKILKGMVCTIALFSFSLSVIAADVELYALSGDTIKVDESEVEAYTSPGMGWFKDKPVTLYSLEGTTTVVPADQVEANKAVGWSTEKPITMYAVDGRTILVFPEQVEANKAVGWYLEEDLPKKEQSEGDVATKEEDKKQETTSETKKEEQEANVNKLIRVKYTDGTVVSVPVEHLKMYIALDWVQVFGDTDKPEISGVIMYDADGNSKEVPSDKVEEYKAAGWSLTKPEIEHMTVYNHKNETKSIAKSSYESYKSTGWYSAYDEAVYAFAAFGDGDQNPGAVKLLENKKYEAAFQAVAEAIKKLEGVDSVYVQMLYDLRTSVTDTWRVAANSPLGFINYFFTERNGQRVVMFDYRNISNVRIKYIGISFEICNKDGDVIERNDHDYYANNLQLAPCDDTRVGWKVLTGNDAVMVKNVKVNEVRFADGTVWKR